MDKFELLGFLLQDLRDNHGPDEEDIGPAILRETTKIYGLVVQHGYLAREMFDLSGLRDPHSEHGVPKQYPQYQTTNYPIAYVVFADSFKAWLLGKDARKRLELIDLVAMIKEWSWLKIKMGPQTNGSIVRVRSSKFAERKIHEKVLFSD